MMMESWQGQLPHEYVTEPIYSRLSADAQLYFSCRHCGLQWRLNPTVCMGNPDAATGLSCRSCQQGELSPVLLRARVEVACSVCGSRSTVHTTGLQPIRCPSCGSDALAVLDVEDPGFQGRFGDLTGGSHMWGTDAAVDAERIVDEVRIASGMPDFVRYMVPAAHFTRRLYAYGDYEREPDAAFRLLTIEGNLLRDYYRRTNELSAGIDSIEVFESSVEAATEDLEKAMSEHNVAMAVYSVLSRGYGEVAELMLERLDLEQTGRTAAERAIEHHRAAMPDQNPEGAMHIARIEHLLGDFLRLSAETDEARRQSIAYFDRALAEPSLPEQLRNAVLDSRASVLAALDEPTEADAAQVESDFEAVLTRDESDRVWSDKLAAWANRALHAESVGDDDLAWDAILRAAGIAQDELDRAVDEVGMRQVANSYVRVFDQVTRIGARQGRSLDALAAVETVRASSLAYPDHGGAPAPEILERNLRWQWRALKGLFGFGGAAASVAERPDLDHTLERLRDVDADLLPADGAHLCIAAASSTITALIVRLEHDGLIVEPYQWAVESGDVEALALPLDSDDAVFDNLDELIDAGYRMLVEPVWDRLEDLELSTLSVSLPGVLSRLAVEAMVSRAGGSHLRSGAGVFNLPSLALGVDLGRRRPPTDPHLLLVTSLDDDLQHAEAESEALRNAFDGRVTTIGGPTQTKDDILRALSTGVSNVHFLCHGSFDPLSPLDSALHLLADPQQDRYRITARDLAAVEFGTSPVVTLAACSSGLTSYGPANDLSGLTGAFLRAGARGVIGSRWDVHDDLAADFMAALYRHLSDLAVSPVAAVSTAQREIRREYDATEDWAAFGYLGVP